MPQQIISAIQRVKTDRDGEYKLVLPVNTVEDVFVSLESGVRLKELLGDIIEEVDDTRLTLTEDLSSVINVLSGLIDVKLPLNHIYRENFRDSDNLTITNGTFRSGYIKITQGQNMDFKFKNPIDLKSLPSKFKLTQITRYIGSPAITALITFNAKDSVPQWYDCTAALTSGLFANVPEIPNKESNKPYSINVRIKCTCNSSSTFEINDLSVLYV